MRIFVASVILIAFIFGFTFYALPPRRIVAPPMTLSDQEYAQFTGYREIQERAQYTQQRVLLDTNALIVKVCSARGIPINQCSLNINTRAIEKVRVPE